MPRPVVDTWTYTHSQFLDHVAVRLGDGQGAAATSEVLKVISSSPGELEPAFNAMLASATRICDAKFGNMFLREVDGYRAIAAHGEAAFVEQRNRPLSPKPWR